MSDTGEIVAWDNAPSHPDGAGLHGGKIVTLLKSDFNQFDPKIHKIDLEYLTIVEKTNDEKADALLPTAFELRSAIFNELQNTDGFMVPDRLNSKRDKWATYRQALRDLSKLATPSDMVNSWPIHPDGDDAIKKLRERLAASMMLRKSES